MFLDQFIAIVLCVSFFFHPMLSVALFIYGVFLQDFPSSLPVTLNTDPSLALPPECYPPPSLIGGVS